MRGVKGHGGAGEASAFPPPRGSGGYFTPGSGAVGDEPPGQEPDGTCVKSKPSDDKEKEKKKEKESSGEISRLV